jgi:hypothetical protein
MDSHWGLVGAAVLSCLVALVFEKIGPVAFGFTLFVVLVVMFLVVPNFIVYRSAGNAGPAGIQVLQRQEVANYHTDVVMARP